MKKHQWLINTMATTKRQWRWRQQQQLRQQQKTEEDRKKNIVYSLNKRKCIMYGRFSVCPNPKHDTPWASFFFKFCSFICYLSLSVSHLIPSQSKSEEEIARKRHCSSSSNVLEKREPKHIRLLGTIWVGLLTIERIKLGPIISLFYTQTHTMIEWSEGASNYSFPRWITIVQFKILIHFIISFCSEPKQKDLWKITTDQRDLQLKHFKR